MPTPSSIWLRLPGSNQQPIDWQIPINASAGIATLHEALKGIALQRISGCQCVRVEALHTLLHTGKKTAAGLLVVVRPGYVPSHPAGDDHEIRLLMAPGAAGALLAGWAPDRTPSLSRPRGLVSVGEGFILPVFT
ncbi:MAG: hypothetical protein IPO61_16615 [Gammaproteobacteria bacterium]|nr:hypothetical protein [Gammaproteobacteria bacterium]